LDDYYGGAAGARRLIRELDQLLQHVLDNLGDAESLDCSIELKVTGADPVRLEKTYRPAERAERGAD
jgi:hypothetical protein